MVATQSFVSTKAGSVGHDTRGGWRALAAAWLAAGLLAVPGAAPAQPPNAGDEGFTASFRLQDCQFETTGRNPHFPLEPGRELFYEAEEDGVSVTLVIAVLRETRRVTLNVGGRTRTVTTRVVEEREYEDGEPVEISRNFFARCAKTNDVYYFGEEVDIYEDGEIVSHDGAWLAGRDGAKPGILMPGTFLLGSRYFQEVAPGVAQDRAEHVAMGFRVETVAGRFSQCVEVTETSPLEPGAESTKVYCPGVGLVKDNDLELVGIRDDEDDD
jgi:hypothetical protein